MAKQRGWGNTETDFKDSEMDQDGLMHTVQSWGHNIGLGRVEVGIP